jgi:hypothetical protein
MEYENERKFGTDNVEYQRTVEALNLQSLICQLGAQIQEVRTPRTRETLAFARASRKL